LAILWSFDLMRRVMLVVPLLLLTQCMAPDIVPSNSRQVQKDWAAEGRSRIGSHLTYPHLTAAERPVRFAITGLQFTIDAAGTVTNPRVARSSGYPKIDEAALQALIKASPLPPPPADLLGAGGKLVVRAPVQFGY
jgi:protein TonB